KLGEQVATQQSSGGLLVDYPGIPAVRRMRRVDVADPLSRAELDYLAILEHARRTVCHVVQRHHAAGATMRGLGMRCDGEPLIHCPAFIGFVLAVGAPG